MVNLNRSHSYAFVLNSLGRLPFTLHKYLEIAVGNSVISYIWVGGFFCSDFKSLTFLMICLNSLGWPPLTLHKYLQIAARNSVISYIWAGGYFCGDSKSLPFLLICLNKLGRRIAQVCGDD